MPVTLPNMFDALDETPLVRSPLVTVVWQLRIDDQPSLVASQSALRLQELLGGRAKVTLMKLPRIQVVAQSNSPAEGEPSSPGVLGAAGGGWRFTSSDGSWHVNVEPASISVETTAYGTWAQNFKPTLETVLQAITAVSSPVLEMRLGLRYVNVLVGNAIKREPFRAVSEFEGVVDQTLLGIVLNPRLREYVQSAQGRFALNLGGLNAIVNHGLVTAESGELGYLLDIDVFREGTRQYASEEVIAATGDLHRVALGSFHACLTSEALRQMQESESPQTSPSALGG